MWLMVCESVLVTGFIVLNIAEYYTNSHQPAHAYLILESVPGGLRFSQLVIQRGNVMGMSESLLLCPLLLVHTYTLQVRLKSATLQDLLQLGSNFDVKSFNNVRDFHKTLN